MFFVAVTFCPHIAHPRTLLSRYNVRRQTALRNQLPLAHRSNSFADLNPDCHLELKSLTQELLFGRPAIHVRGTTPLLGAIRGPGAQRLC